MATRIIPDEDKPSIAIEISLEKPLPDYDLNEIERPTPRDVDGILVSQGFRDLVDDARGVLLEIMGTLHGGILCDIADTAMGVAFASTLAPGETFTTVELKINYLRPVREAKLRAEGRVVQRGRTIGYAECEVTDENGKLIAKSNSTCLVLRGEQASGR